jgi:lysophospholipase L1-like esterase
MQPPGRRGSTSLSECGTDDIIAGLIRMRLSNYLLVLVAVLVGSLVVTTPTWAADHPFEKDIQAFEAADRANPPKPGAILFVGDSQFTRWKALPQDLPEYRIIRRGFGGSKMSDLLYYTNRVVLPYRPRLIVVNEGGNDIHGGRTPEAVLADVKAFVERVRAAMPDVPIVFDGLTSSPARANETAPRLRCNALLKAYVASGKKLGFVDLYDAFLGPDGKPNAALFGPDRLHCNPAGYAVRVRLMRPFLGPPDYPGKKSSL